MADVDAMLTGAIRRYLPEGSCSLSVKLPGGSNIISRVVLNVPMAITRGDIDGLTPANTRAFARAKGRMAALAVAEAMEEQAKNIKRKVLEGDKGEEEAAHAVDSGGIQG